MREDIELLQGTWSVKSLEIDEREMPTSMLANASILVEGNRFISLGMGAEYEGTLELGPSTTPAELNMKFDGGPEKGNVNRGIYELDGDTWKICIATTGSVRPTVFSSRPAGSGFVVELLARVPRY
jgi:uncharacterized protein (TIGR03067 family)